MESPTITLAEYAQQINQKTEMSRTEVLGINTLWLPENSGNRTAKLNLNHQINGFNQAGELWGENGNCCTPYRIIEVPMSLTEQDIDRIGDAVNAATGNTFEQGYRSLVARNADVAIEVIAKMFA